MSPPVPRAAALDDWFQRDLEIAVTPADREIVQASATLRALIADRVTGAADDDLFDACAMLGRFIGQRGGSPTLASGTMDHAAQALGAPNATWTPGARGALAEGYVSTRLDAERRAALASWDYPGCAVPLGDAAIAIAAGNPAEDDELLATWAARVAKAAAMQGIRTAVISGADRPCAAVREALTLVGITVKAR